MTERFISQSLTPSGDQWFTMPEVGLPSLPAAFDWNGQKMVVDKVIKTWKRFGQDKTHGSGETYVHKHFYELATNLGTAVVYFERQPRMRNQAERWILYTLDSSNA